jgi:hypothetical protein
MYLMLTVYYVWNYIKSHGFNRQFVNNLHYYVLSSTYLISLVVVKKFTGEHRWKVPIECYNTD